MNWSWRLLRAGAFRLDGGSMFGVVPKAVWSRLVQPDDENRIPLQTNCLLLDRPDDEAAPQNAPRRVLIETGYGEKWSAKDRAIFAMEQRTILDALAEVNVAPESIDLIVLTHLHFDHAAALTRLDSSNEPTPTFPNADIIVQKTEWEDALANKSTMTKTYLRSHLDPVADRVRPVDGEAEAAPGIAVFPVPGHTWGQQAVRFHDEHGVVCFPGDLVPTVNHVGLAFSMGYDMLPYRNMLTKKTLLQRAHRESWRLVLDHEPGDPVVRVVEDDRPGKFSLAAANVHQE